LPFYRRVFVTATPSSHNNLKTLLQYFGYEKFETLEVLRQLTRTSPKDFAHFMIDATSRDVTLQRLSVTDLARVDQILNKNSLSNPNFRTREQLEREREIHIKNNVKELLEPLEEAYRKIGERIFDLIYAKAGNLISDKDFTIKVTKQVMSKASSSSSSDSSASEGDGKTSKAKGKETFKPFKCSVISYIYMLMDDKWEEDRSDQKLINLHFFLVRNKHLFIPNKFIKNRQFVRKYIRKEK
jgi:hypothetical protein